MSAFPIVVDDNVIGLTMPMKPNFGGPFCFGVQTGVRYLFANSGGFGVIGPIGVYKSVDSGATWEFVAESDPVCSGAPFSCAQKDFKTIGIVFYTTLDPDPPEFGGFEFDMETDTFSALFSSTALPQRGNATFCCEYDSDGILVVAGDFNLNASNFQVASWVTWDGTSWSDFILFPPASGDPDDVLQFFPVEMKLCGTIMQVILLWGARNPLPAPVVQLYSTSIGSSSLTAVGGSVMHYGEGYGYVPTTISYDSTSDEVVLLCAGLMSTDLLGPYDITHLKFDRRANSPFVVFSLSLVEAGSTGPDNICNDVTSVQLDEAGGAAVTMILWRLQDQVDPGQAFLMSASLTGLDFSPIEVIGELDNIQNLAAGKVTGLFGWAIAFLASQDYWEIAGPVGTPGNQTIIFMPVILPDPSFNCDHSLWQKCYEVDGCGNQVIRSKVPMSFIDYNALQNVLVNNQIVPPEGPRVIPVQLDFTNTDTIEVDLGQLQQRGFMNMVQTVFVDLNGNANNLVIKVNGALQNIVCKANTQGYYTILAPNPAKLAFVCVIGGGTVTVHLCNSPISGSVWVTL